MLCYNCRSMLPDQSVVCPVCRAQLRAAPPQSYRPQFDQPAIERRTHTNARARRGDAAAVAMLIALIGFGAVMTGLVMWWRNGHTRPTGLMTDSVNRIREIRKGDTWTHRFTIEMAINGTKLIEQKGTVTTTLKEGQLDGKPVLLMSAAAKTDLSFMLTYRAGRYMWQDPATGDIYELAEYTSLTSGIKHATPPVVIEPGRWSDKLNHGYKLTFEDGVSGEVKRQVIGLEKVKTAAGEFPSWKRLITVQANAQGRTIELNLTSWYAPQVSDEVKIEGAFEHQGISVKIAGELESTNVPH